MQSAGYLLTKSFDRMRYALQTGVNLQSEFE